MENIEKINAYNEAGGGKVMKLEIGTKIKGNVNNAEMVIVGFQNADVILKDLKTDKVFSYGLEALKRCNITILE